MLVLFIGLLLIAHLMNTGIRSGVGKAWISVVCSFLRDSLALSPQPKGVMIGRVGSKKKEKKRDLGTD